jgi:c-di-GMP-binding flagellar brake protein YcgR
VLEKRQFKRVPLNVTVEATAGGRTLRFESRNISVGGLLLRGEETLHENDTFHMKFHLPGRDEAVAATAVVQHVSPEAFMGVRFTELSEDVRRAIENYVKEAPVPQP